MLIIFKEIKQPKHPGRLDGTAAEKRKETDYPVIYHNVIYRNQVLKYNCNIQKKHSFVFSQVHPPFHYSGICILYYIYIYFKGGIFKVLNSNWPRKLQL